MLQEACEAFATPQQLIDSGCSCQLDPVSDAQLILDALDEASDTLTILSGMRYGGRCSIIARPVRSNSCSCGPRYGYVYGNYAYSGGYSSMGYPYGWLADACGCDRTSRVPLRTPVGSITQVVVDGVVQDPATYALMDGQYLIRYAADATDQPNWPGCQDLSKTPDQAGTFAVFYTVGPAPSLIDRQAAIELACELISTYRTGKGAVSGATGFSGGGVQIQRKAVVDQVREVGSTMIAVQRFISFWNPKGTRVPNGAWSPEVDGGWTSHSIG